MSKSRYRRHTFDHESAPGTIGVLLANLGTPDACDTGAVRRYLGEFLADPRVIEAPRWIWRLALHGYILRVRPARSAAAYRQVWTDEGSPLLAISRRQAAALEATLRERCPGTVHVALGMRYGRPSIAAALHELESKGATRFLVLPLYPQYSATTTASVFDAVAGELRRWRWIPELRFVSHYHDDPGYVDALAASVRDTADPAAHLLFSFHGIPRRYFDDGDPYFCHCQKTARLVAERLDLAPDAWTVGFQSRVGPAAWLEPYTETLLEDWGRAGRGRLSVVCPGFAADCLETLEEIAIRDRALYRDAGGGELDYVPALNDRADHVAALAGIVERHAGHWWQAPASAAPDDAHARAARARAMGAPG